MTESLDPIERLPDTKDSDRVNPTDRSNPEKKDSGFSNLLKEKMKEKLKEKAQQKDEVILENAPEDDNRPESPDSPGETEPAEATENENGSEESPPEHVDLKA